jgi:hypothetical protein
MEARRDERGTGVRSENGAKREGGGGDWDRRSKVYRSRN